MVRFVQNYVMFIGTRGLTPFSSGTKMTGRNGWGTGIFWGLNYVFIEFAPLKMKSRAREGDHSKV